MESAERKIMKVLLEQLYKEGLISKSTCAKAGELVHSVIALPEFFWYSDVLDQNVLSEGAKNDEHSEDSQ